MSNTTTQARIVRTENGETTTYTPAEYVEAGGSLAGVINMAIRQGILAEGLLAEDVVDNKRIVERATEEDVFVGRVDVPGWLVNDKDGLTRSTGSVHPGATITVDGLVEDYSEKAFRVVAREDDVHGDAVYHYAWAFLPKSQVTVTRVEGVEDREAGWAFQRAAQEARRAHRDAGGEEWSWDKDDDAAEA